MSNNSVQYFHNPVEVVFGSGARWQLGDIVGYRRALVVTSPGFIARGLAERLVPVLGPSLIACIGTVDRPPTFTALRELYQRVWSSYQDNVDLLVAIGGGSVIDAAKTLAVIPNLTATVDFDAVEDHIRGLGRLRSYRVLPLIVLPTTAGTGAEVTPWASVYDDQERRKYSLHLPHLWPKTAIVDPELTLSLPPHATIAAGLDALSHALEAIWNVNRSLVSTTLAVTAAQTIIHTLPALLAAMESVSQDVLPLREAMHGAALSAGIAFSTTKTALAHALSYGFAFRTGVPHGIACSFSLPAVLAHNAGLAEDVDEALCKIFSVKTIPECIERLRSFFASIGVSNDYREYGLSETDFADIITAVAANPRFRNNLRQDLDGFWQ